MLDKYPKRAETTASRIVDNEAVIVIPNEGMVRILNETGARSWDLFDGKNTLKEIINIICAEFDVSWDDAKQDIIDFIQELEQKDMVVLNSSQQIS